METILPRDDLLEFAPSLKHGEKISLSGIYRVPMLDYHGDLCLGPSISSSGLRTILSRTPRSYWHTSPLNPNREEPDDAENAAMRIGRAAHTMVMESHLFRQLYVTRPDSWDSWRTKEAREWRAEKQMAGCTVLDVKEYAQVVGIAAALAEHPLVAQGLLAGHLEMSLVWQDEETGVWLKSRPDAIPESANIYGDLKTMHNVHPDFLRREFFQRGIHVQMGLADEGLEKLLDRKMEEYVVVAVEQKAPHDILIAPIDPEAIGWGRRLVRKAVRIFADCLDKGRWPSYEKRDTEYIRLPDWQVKIYQTDPELAG